jgi:hypothetical protein
LIPAGGVPLAPPKPPPKPPAPCGVMTMRSAVLPDESGVTWMLVPAVKLAAVVVTMRVIRVVAASCTEVTCPEALVTRMPLAETAVMVPVTDCVVRVRVQLGVLVAVAEAVAPGDVPQAVSPAPSKMAAAIKMPVRPWRTQANAVLISLVLLFNARTTSSPDPARARLSASSESVIRSSAAAQGYWNVNLLQSFGITRRAACL